MLVSVGCEDHLQRVVVLAARHASDAAGEVAQHDGALRGEALGERRLALLGGAAGEVERAQLGAADQTIGQRLDARVAQSVLPQVEQGEGGGAAADCRRR